QAAASRSAMLVPTTIYVARDGDVGLWIPQCPFCGFEHTHGPYRFYDIREAFKAVGGSRSPHCHQALWPVPNAKIGTYQLTPAPGPSRFARATVPGGNAGCGC